MTVIADSSFVYALYNTRDAHHQAAMRFVSPNAAELLVPGVALPEICFLLNRDIGYYGMQRFILFFTRLDAKLEPVGMEDLKRVRAIAMQYADARFDLVDCCIMAMAERLNITRVATFDQRDFSIFKPDHCEFLELQP